MKNVSLIFDRAISVVLTVAVVVFVVAFVRRSGPPGQQQPAQPQLSYVKGWRELLVEGHQRTNGKEYAAGQVQDSVQRVEIIEFVDFECPYCKRFDAVLQVVERKFEGKLRRTFIHTPIPSHRFAYPAARMSECAAAQGKFWQMHDALLAKQDSFGLRQWTAYAKDAGLHDIPEFERCAGESTPVAAIERSLGLREEFQITGTPTVFLNGWRLAVAPQVNDEVFSALIDQFLAGKKDLEIAGKKFSRAVEVIP